MLPGKSFSRLQVLFGRLQSRERHLRYRHGPGSRPCGQKVLRGAGFVIGSAMACRSLACTRSQEISKVVRIPTKAESVARERGDQVSGYGCVEGVLHGSERSNNVSSMCYEGRRRTRTRFGLPSQFFQNDLPSESSSVTCFQLIAS